RRPLRPEEALRPATARGGPSARHRGGGARRAVMRRLENFDMRVEFHPDMLPARIWWAVWDGVEGEIIEREPAAPGSQHEVHRYLRAVEKTVVGFCWSWPPEDGR